MFPSTPRCIAPLLALSLVALATQAGAVTLDLGNGALVISADAVNNPTPDTPVHVVANGGVTSNVAPAEVTFINTCSVNTAGSLPAVTCPVLEVEGEVAGQPIHALVFMACLGDGAYTMPGAVACPYPILAFQNVLVMGQFAYFPNGPQWAPEGPAACAVYNVGPTGSAVEGTLCVYYTVSQGVDGTCIEQRVVTWPSSTRTGSGTEAGAQRTCVSSDADGEKVETCASAQGPTSCLGARVLATPSLVCGFVTVNPIGALPDEQEIFCFSP